MTDVLAATRCPQCVALVRPGQPWCTLCHADLRPAPEPPAAEPAAAEPAAPAPDAEAEPTDRHDDPLVDPLPDLLAVTDPTPSGKHARHAAGSTQAAPLEETAGTAAADEPPISQGEIDAMLAQLALESGRPLDGVAGRLDSMGAKVALATGVGVVAMVCLFVAAFVIVAIVG